MPELVEAEVATEIGTHVETIAVDERVAGTDGNVRRHGPVQDVVFQEREGCKVEIIKVGIEAGAKAAE